MNEPQEPPASTNDAPNAPAPYAYTGEVPYNVLALLKDTRAWVRFVAVVWALANAFMVLMGLTFLTVGSAMMGPGGQRLPGWMGLVYVAMGAFWAFPLVQLFRFSGTVDSLLADGRTATLEQALDFQRSFWKALGVMTLVALGAYALTCVVAMFMGMATAMRGGH